MPGGVNSPVRAMRAIGRDHPVFVERGEGCELVDVDGNRYVDWVCSWGPLILGHAHPGVVEAVRRRGRAGDELRGADRGRGGAGGGGLRAVRVGGDGADGQLGNRGVDERRPPGAGGDRARQGGEVRRRLPRARRRAAGRGRLGAGDAGDPGEPGGDRGAGGRHDRRPVERPRGGGGGARRAPGGGDPGRAGAGEHGSGPAGRRLPGLPARAGRRRRRAAGASTR